MAVKDNHRLGIEVVHADGRQVHVLSLEVARGTTVRQAIELSGILELCPEIDLDRNKVGMFSEVCRLDTLVEDDCRIEIYRPLLTDPKEARRQRAVAEKS